MASDATVHTGFQRVQTEVLQKYFYLYLKNVQQVKESTIKHYSNALNVISKMIAMKGLVENNIYEILDINRLNFIQKAVLSDKDFVEKDQKGHRMYTAALNRYMEFALGEKFQSVCEREGVDMDVPVLAFASKTSIQKGWRRSGILKAQAIAMARYACEIDPSHGTFIAESTSRPYLEGHHAIPLMRQQNFDVSLDVYANIVSLCPLCHRQIHYGLQKDRLELIGTIYDNRAGRLEKSGIILRKDDFISLANCTY